MTRLTRLAAHGLAVAPPAPWEARIYLRDDPQPVSGEPPTRRSLIGGHPAAYGHPGESMNPVLHLANFPLPPGRGDFGTGAVERMGRQHAFVSLLEYDRVEAGRPLFAARGLPRPTVTDFAPNQLQRRLAGQLGCQRFCTVDGRAFCLYVVLGSAAHAPALISDVHRILDTVEVDSSWQRP